MSTSKRKSPTTSPASLTDHATEARPRSLSSVIRYCGGSAVSASAGVPAQQIQTTVLTVDDSDFIRVIPAERFVWELRRRVSGNRDACGFYVANPRGLAVRCEQRT